jgi:hypothetical protein
MAAAATAVIVLLNMERLHTGSLPRIGK